MHPEFEKVMDCAARNLKNTDTTLITNAWLLDEAKARAIIDAGITQVAASVHSTDPGHYQMLSGLKRKDAFDRVKENIERLAHLRGRRKWPKITINAVAMKSTINDLDGLADWVADSKIDGLRILWILPIDTDFFKQEYIRPTEEHKRLLHDIKLKLKAKKKFYDHPLISSKEKVMSVLCDLKNTRRPLEYFLFALRKFTTAVFNKQCKIGGLSIFVDQNGVISACPDGRRPLGHFSELPDKKFYHLVTDAVKNRNKQTCGDCGFLKAMEIERTSSKQ